MKAYELGRADYVFWALAAAIPGVAHAGATPHIDAALFAETRAPSPGQTVRVAVRMNPAAWASLPTDACALGRYSLR
mgnify:CR=1 FL=1